ncbi:MAG: sugar isomerase domain-containing protein [Eubacteriales bacterium]
MNAADLYLNEIKRLISQIETTQNDVIESASLICAEALINGNMIYTFGTGHSHIMAEEVFYRAGGLVRIYPVLESSLMLHNAAARSSDIERMAGFAKILLDDIDCIKQGDVIFIFSNSGRNTVSVDMAIEAKKRGMTVICITNMAHSSAVTSRHPSGLRLFEVCDIYIDNCGCIGDAAVVIGDYTAGPTSTVIGAMIMQMIVCRIIEIAKDRNTVPEVFRSANTDGGDEANHAYIKKYKNIIKSL